MKIHLKFVRRSLFNFKIFPGFFCSCQCQFQAVFMGRAHLTDLNNVAQHCFIKKKVCLNLLWLKLLSTLGQD